MADAKKCDVCGAYYVVPINNYSVYLVVTQRFLSEEPHTVDLCPKCAKRLKEWLDNNESK